MRVARHDPAICRRARPARAAPSAPRGCAARLPSGSRCGVVEHEDVVTRRCGAMRPSGARQRRRPSTTSARLAPASIAAAAALSALSTVVRARPAISISTRPAGATSVKAWPASPRARAFSARTSPPMPYVTTRARLRLRRATTRGSSSFSTATIRCHAYQIALRAISSCDAMFDVRGPDILEQRRSGAHVASGAISPRWFARSRSLCPLVATAAQRQRHAELVAEVARERTGLLRQDSRTSPSSSSCRCP